MQCGKEEKQAEETSDNKLKESGNWEWGKALNTDAMTAAAEMEVSQPHFQEVLCKLQNTLDKQTELQAFIFFSQFL